MARNYAAATLAYGELDDLADILDRSELTTDDLRSVCLNLTRAVERLQREVQALRARANTPRQQ